MAGWVKIKRSLLDWEWYDDHNATRLLLHLNLTVNFEDKQWKGILIKRGSMVLSWATLSKSIGLSVKQCRTAMDKLISSKEVTKVSTNKFQVITLVKWDKIQLENGIEGKQEGKQMANKGQAEGKQRATTKERKENKELKNIINRKAEFKNSLLPFFDNYTSGMLNEFSDYWTEHGEKDRKMRFEKEKSFSLELRLKKWFANQQKWEKEKSSGKKEKRTAAQKIRDEIEHSNN
jgi:hypothetical protein